jgi:RNA polymerase sigma factor (sigma-70 family)
MQSWASRYLASRDIYVDADDIAQEAFTNFWRAVSGEKFDQKFQVLPQIIRYMQMCVHNAILQYWRSYGDGTAPLPDIDLAITDHIEEDSEIEALWSRICEILPNPKHKLLARLSFILEIKPKEIVEFEAYSAVWPRPRDVSVMLYQIRQKLNGDNELKNWLSQS